MPTDWLRFRARVCRHELDELAGFLHEIAPGRVVITEIHNEQIAQIDAYLPANESHSNWQSRFQSYPILREQNWQVKSIQDEDWQARWKREQRPLLISSRIYIRPPWHDEAAPTGAIPITLEPGMAFGTGRHESTQLCIQQILHYALPGMTVLDLGCGTGILSLVAAKLGAASVLALDNDSQAVRSARENAGLNGVSERIQVEEAGSLAAIRNSARRFDLAVINIRPAAILNYLREGLAHCLRPGGRAIMSGILASELAAVAAALPDAGFVLERDEAQGEWRCIVAKKTNGA